MKLTVPEKIGRLIERRMRSGKYRTARDVLIAALMRLDEHERLAGASEADLAAMYPQIKAKISRGTREAAAGKLSDGESFFDELKAAHPLGLKAAAANQNRLTSFLLLPHMPKYLLTDSAKADIIHIAGFVRRRSPRAAGELCRDLRNAMRKLAEFPGMGHYRDDLAGHDLRFWCVRSHLIIYLHGSKPLTIIRVAHGAQDLKKLLNPE